MEFRLARHEWSEYQHMEMSLVTYTMHVTNQYTGWYRPSGLADTPIYMHKNMQCCSDESKRSQALPARSRCCRTPA
jgi:hypothetical protein